MRRLIQIVEHYSTIYFCDVASFCVMGNHYHLVVKFDRIREVDPDPGGSLRGDGVAPLGDHHGLEPEDLET